MPGMRCAVAVCSNSYFKTRNRTDGVSYFRFPKQENLRRLWVERCKRKDKFNPDTSYICSDHFRDDDFITNLRTELMGSKQKKFIGKNVVPSIKLLPHMYKQDETKPARKDRSKEKEKIDMVTNLLQNAAPGTSDADEMAEQTHNSTSLQREAENIDYKSEYLLLKESFEKHKTEHELKIKLLQEECNMLKEEKNASVAEEVRSILKRVFSETQIDIILKKKKRVKVWSSEEITTAFTIRYLSKRCYIFLRNKMNIPLPCLTTLKEWAAKLCFHSGVLHGVIKLMEVAAIKMKTFEKLVVLQFDEMKVMSVYEYDSVSDKLFGPYSHVQVVMVRSLFAFWKQPVFVDFDTKMTKRCLDDIIERLYDVGLTVVAIVSDCGGGNIGVWKEYGVSYEKSYSYSDITQRNLYFFADVPHLLKLIRNWYIDGGFVTSGGTHISPEPLKMFVNNTSELEISSCYKLTPKHINCEKFKRQNVLLAAQVMSNTVACALRRYEVCDEAKRMSAADFIKSTNDWFDVMNSRIPNSSLELQCGYGLHLINQRNSLLKYIKIIRDMKCVNKKVIQTFQKGIIMSSVSLMKLFEELKADFKISYILTAKLNQDSLENFFSAVRGAGGCNDHPTPLECLYRMRMIVLGKTASSLRVNSNTHESEGEFMVGKVLAATSVLVDDIRIPPEANACGSDSEHEQECNTSGNKHPPYDIAEHPISQKTYVEETVSSDGLSYISGWMAKKLKTKYPDLGNYTCKNQRNGTWISELSAGGLTEPTIDFQTTIARLEDSFQKYTEGGLPRYQGLSRDLFTKLKSEATEVPDDIIELFVKRRIAMRVKFLNRTKLDRKFLNRQKQKTCKKLKKLVT